MLITTIEQIREVIGGAVRKENTLEILKPYMEKAEERLLTELIGSEQLEALSETASGLEIKLKILVTKAIIWNGYQDAWYQGFYEFSGSGIKKQAVKDTESLFRYQEDTIQKDIVRKADEATEQLMLFLEDNANDFPLYKNSDAFKNNFSYLISTPTALQRSLPEVSKSYRMYQVLKVYMPRVENTTVRTITGDLLYEDLKSKISSGAALDGNYKRLLALAQDYSAPATLLDAMPWISVQFTPSGIRVLKVFNNLNDETPLTTAQTDWLTGILRNRVDSSKTALRMFLNLVASETVFPDYFNSSLYRVPGSKQWTMPDNAGKKHFRM